MKQYAYLTFAIVLTAVLLVGCGCTNQNMTDKTEPTVLPTNEERWESTEATTRATTEATMPSETQDQGNGPLEDRMPETTGGTESTQSTEGSMTGRSGSMIPGMR